MTVGAADIALRELGLDDAPSDMSVQQLRDAGDLVSTVIELEHDRIPLTAVDAGVVQKVIEDAVLVRDVDSSYPGVDPIPRVLEVRLIEALGGGDVAGAAPALVAVSRCGLPVKLAQRLDLTTLAAALRVLGREVLGLVPLLSISHG